MIIFSSREVKILDGAVGERGGMIHVQMLDFQEERILHLSAECKFHNTPFPWKAQYLVHDMAPFNIE